MDSDDIEMVVGFPEFWQQAHDVNSAAFQAIKELRPLKAELFSKPVAEPLHKVTRMIAKITYNSLGALTTLLLNGYGSDGMKIARSMYEAAITTAYLKKHPCQVEDFLDYHHILNKRNLEYLIENSQDANNISGTRRDEIDAEYQRVLPRFQYKGGRPRTSWCRKSIYGMADEVGEKYLYHTFYKTASGLHHGDVRSLTTQNEQTLDVNMAPSLSWISEAFVMGHFTVVLTLTNYNQIAGHGMNEQMDRAGEAFERAWGINAQA